MYVEAFERLEPLVKQDEFNPGLQFALGEVLMWMKDFPKAAHHFDVAQRLDRNFWQAALSLAAANLCIWENTRDPASRTRGGQNL